MKIEVWPPRAAFAVGRHHNGAAPNALNVAVATISETGDVLAIDHDVTIPVTAQLSVSSSSTAESSMATHSPTATPHSPTFKRILRRFKWAKDLKLSVPAAEATTPKRNTIASHPRNSTASSTSSTGSDDSDVDEELYWGPVPSIPNWRVRELVLRLLGSTICDSCWVHDIKQGSYNHVFMVMFGNGDKVCLKIPATGWTKRWTPEDAAELRREALTLKYIRQELGGTFPAPELLAYDITMNNEIDAPYMLMSCLPGTSAIHSWYTSKWKDEVSSDYHLYEHRKKILESLAHHMAKLRNITFPAIGVLDFDNDACENPHVVAEMRAFTDYDDEQDPEHPYPKTWIKIEIQSETKSFFKTMMDNVPFEDSTDDRARRAFLKPVVYHLPPSWDARPQPMPEGPYRRQPEMFSLSHDDLDLQNILCDDDGNVIGILDWERVTVRPHFMGYQTIPMWIREDMNDGKPWPFNSQRIESPAQMAQFRRLYSKFLDDAIGRIKGITMDESDALPRNFSCMSHLGHALYDGLRFCGPDQLRHFCDIVATMVFPNTPLRTLYKELGRLGRSCDGFKLPESEDYVKDLSIWLMKRCESVIVHGLPKDYEWIELLDFDDTVEPIDDESDVDESDLGLTGYFTVDASSAVKKFEVKPTHAEVPHISGESSPIHLPSSSRPSSRGSNDCFDNSDTASTQSSLTSDADNDSQTQPDYGKVVLPLVCSNGCANLVAAEWGKCAGNKHLIPLLDWSLPPDSMHQAQRT